MSIREKERGECRLGAWLYHPLHSTEEWDLGEHQREGTGRVEIEGMATLYTGTASCLSPRREERGEKRLGSWLPCMLPFTEECDLGQRQREGTGRVEIGGLPTLHRVTVSWLRNGIFATILREGTRSEEMGGLATLCPIHRKKRFASFPSPAGMSLPNSPWAGIMTS